MHSKATRRTLVLITAGVALVWVNSLGWLAPVKNTVGTLFNPLSAVFAGTGSRAGNFFRTVGEIRQLAADNARLSNEVADLKQQLASDAELKRQNEDLRAQLNFTGVPTENLIPAEVIGYQPDNFRGFMTIGRGRRDGVQSGMAVISQGSLVGRISDVSDSSAKVFLVTDPEFKINGLDQQTRASGTISGQLGTGLAMDKIAQSDVVKSGDTIITSGLGGGIPKGIIVGQVESVNQRDNAVFQTALLASDVQFSKLELIFVVNLP